MNFIARKLEEFGQNPRTFSGEALFFVARFFVLILLIQAPLWIVFSLLNSFFPSQPATAGPAPLSPVIFLIIVPFMLYMWFAVLTVMSLVGSWFWLARKFRAPQNYKPQQIARAQTGNVGVVSMNNVLNVGAAPEGLYLSLFRLFAFMQPPLLIPWSEIVAARQKKFLFHDQLWLTVGQPKLATIVLAKPKSVQLVFPYVAPVLKTRHTDN